MVGRFSASPAVLAFVLAIGIAGNIARADGFVNNWDKPFVYQCPGRQTLSSVYSIHNNYYEDRRFKFSCRTGPHDVISTTCKWSEQRTYSDQPVNFMCSADWAITGVDSYHTNINEDRRFKFKCCKLESYKTTGCEMTSFLNALDGEMDYSVPEGRVLVGWFSEHDDKTEDRRHKMLTCSLRL